MKAQGKSIRQITFNCSDTSPHGQKLGLGEAIIPLHRRPSERDRRQVMLLDTGPHPNRTLFGSPGIEPIVLRSCGIRRLWCGR